MREKKRDYQKNYDKATNFAAQRKYNKKNIRRIALDLNINTDGDILDWLDSTDMSKTSAIKQAVRYYIKSK